MTELADRLGDWWQAGQAHSLIALHLGRGDPAATELHLATASEAVRRSGDPYAAVVLASIRGSVASRQNRWSEARRWLIEGEQGCRGLGDRRGELVCRSELAHVARRSGALDESEAIYRETIGAWQQMGNRGAIANQLEYFAFLAVTRGKRFRVARLLGAAESLREAAGAAMGPVEREDFDAAVAQMRLHGDDLAVDAAWAE